MLAAIAVAGSAVGTASVTFDEVGLYGSTVIVPAGAAGVVEGVAGGTAGGGLLL
jgi:hypothetical protein